MEFIKETIQGLLAFGIWGIELLFFVICFIKFCSAGG